ncbi:hypothetical protein FGG08_007041, partial [Glutinoglossum americanum]
PTLATLLLRYTGYDTDMDGHSIGQTDHQKKLVRIGRSRVGVVENGNLNTRTRIGNFNLWTRISNITSRPTRYFLKDKKAKHQSTAGVASTGNAYQY